MHKILLLGACLLAVAWLPANADECSPEGHDRASRALRDRLYPMLEAGDDPGFAAPFAALVLSEVARTDRAAPWMTSGERATMVERAASYVESVRDYRGYVAGEGWRHGVAHGAGWLMQLSLNPALDRAQLDRVLAASASQAAPASGHAYVFGEPGRLAWPLLFIAQRQQLSLQDWQAWLARLQADVAGTKQQDFGRWLARRHDLVALLSVLYLRADQSGEPGMRDLKPAIEAALKAAGGPS